MSLIKLRAGASKPPDDPAKHYMNLVENQPDLTASDFVADLKVMCKWSDDIYYEATVIKIKREGDQLYYTLHYKNWGHKYDEKIPLDDAIERCKQYTATFAKESDIEHKRQLKAEEEKKFAPKKRKTNRDTLEDTPSKIKQLKIETAESSAPKLSRRESAGSATPKLKLSNKAESAPSKAKLPRPESVGSATPKLKNSNTAESASSKAKLPCPESVGSATPKLKLPSRNAAEALSSKTKLPRPESVGSSKAKLSNTDEPLTSKPKPQCAESTEPSKSKLKLSSREQAAPTPSKFKPPSRETVEPSLPVAQAVLSESESSSENEDKKIFIPKRLEALALKKNVFPVKNSIIKLTNAYLNEFKVGNRSTSAFGPYAVDLDSIVFNMAEECREIIQKYLLKEEFSSYFKEINEKRQQSKTDLLNMYDYLDNKAKEEGFPSAQGSYKQALLKKKISEKDIPGDLDICYFMRYVVTFRNTMNPSASYYRLFEPIFTDLLAFINETLPADAYDN